MRALIAISLLLVGCGPSYKDRSPDSILTSCIYQVSRGGPVSEGAVAECAKFAREMGASVSKEN